MTIRQKFLATIGAITICLSLIFYSIIAPMVNRRFEQHEMDSAINKLKRVHAVFNSQIKNMGAFVSHWANWNDVSLLTSGSGENSVAARFLENTFVGTTGIDFLLIFDSDNRLTYEKYFGGRIDSSHRADNVLTRSIPLYDQTSGQYRREQSRSGIVRLGDNYLTIAASPVRDSSSNTSFRGTLVMGQLLDKQQVDLIQDVTLVSLSSIDIYPIGAGPQDVAEAALMLSRSSSPYWTKAVSSRTLKGYTILNDISGAGLLMLVTSFDRIKHKKHHEDLPFLFWSVILCSIVFGVVCFFFIEFFIIRRFTTLIADVNKIELDKIPGARIEEGSAGDEFGNLSRSLNKMLAANEKLEEYKTKSNMLESVATFAAGATHELSTPLSTIAVASGEMLRDVVKGEIVKEDLTQDLVLIREQIGRCRYIVNQMAANTVSHTGEEVVSFSIHELIDDTLVQFKQSEVSRINVEIQVGNPQLCMPFHGLCRVIRGLLRNAFQASGDSAVIFLSCTDNRTHLIFRIRDEGHGMDKETLTHAADPFFSTKDPDDNLGLGLYLAQSLASRFGGDLEISSTAGSGTTVLLSFARNAVYV